MVLVQDWFEPAPQFIEVINFNLLPFKQMILPGDKQSIHILSLHLPTAPPPVGCVERFGLLHTLFLDIHTGLC